MNTTKVWGTLLLGLVFTTSAFATNLDNFENFEVDTDLVTFESDFEKGKRPPGMTNRVRAYDPINKVKYQKVVLGEVQKATGFFKSYDYFRYVTVYDAFEEEERIAYLPYVEEACFDDSFFFAQWDESRSITVTLSSSIGFEKLGLSASVGMSIAQGTTFSIGRRLKATKGIKARHYPFKRSESHEGVTYIQTYNSKTKKYGYLAQSIYDSWTDSYPYEFYLDNQNVGFVAKREILEKCEGYDEESKEDDTHAIFGGRSKTK